MARVTKAASQEPLVMASKVSSFLGGLSASTLKDWRVRGTGPKYYKVGKHVMYRISEVSAWLEAECASNAGADGEVA